MVLKKRENNFQHVNHSHYHHHLVKFILSKLRYPKLTAYLVFILLAYYFFTSDISSSYVSLFISHGYWSIFLAGLLFSYGFTTPFAIGIFVFAEPSNIFLASVIAGVGAFLADLVIFTFIRFNMMDEFQRLQKTKPLRSFDSFFHKYVNVRLQKVILYVVAGFIIASPLPDEIGVLLLAGLSKTHPVVFGIISFTFNTLGIFVMLSLF
ncbi:MAG: hypothetical protein ACP5NS_04005 [Candidatus Pacearchaeota archaeon]